jgi:uncharacterized protein YcnI
MKINKKITGTMAIIWVAAFSYSGVAMAHVVVKPSDAKTGAYQTFTVSVPAEKDNPTVSVKLLIPEKLTAVTPTVKPGWAIETEKHGEGDETMITAINWTGGKINAGYRDDFTFSAKTPDQPTDLQWKAYQTYQDGTMVSWDQQSAGGSGDKENATTGPFSVTKVATDSDQDRALKNVNDKVSMVQSTVDRSLLMSMIAIVVALVSAGLAIVAVRKSRL